VKTIGERIRGLREDLDMSQVRLAGIVGVTKATMSKYENNAAIPKADLIEKMASTLHTSADYLVGLTDNQNMHHSAAFSPRLSDTETELLQRFKSLSPENKGRLLERAEILAEQQSGRKHHGTPSHTPQKPQKFASP